MTNDDLTGEPDLTTPDGVIRLMMSSKNLREWTANCDAVKEANGGAYPAFWYGAMITSGRARELAATWDKPIGSTIISAP